MGLFSRSNRKHVEPLNGIHNPQSRHGVTTNHALSLKSPTFKSTSTTSIATPSITGKAGSFPKVDLPKAPEPTIDPAAYLKSIGSVRERCSLVSQKAQKNELKHFEVDMTKFPDATSFVISIIKRDFAPNYASIPPHGRWQHFNIGGRDRIQEFLNSWPATVNAAERTRRLLDLFLVSVLLDAGAGTTWSYKCEGNGRTYKRSEGLAIASLAMFKSGMFSSNSSQPHQVDGEALKKLTVEKMARGLQISSRNSMPGLEGRAQLLIRLGQALTNQDFFGSDARPGGMLDYLLAHPTTQASSVPVVTIPTLWNVIMNGLAQVWPSSRTKIDSISLGDAWPLSTMSTIPSRSSHNPSSHQPWELIVPFHKLSQWLCYSLMQPMSKLMHIRFAGAELLTGLPEYRNGGLFIDTGVLTLKPLDHERGVQTFKFESSKEGGRYMEVVPMFEPSDDVIVEWRAVTVGFLDLLLEAVNDHLGYELTLPQMLEAGSWKGGRELAEVSRPNTKEPPIMILSDGTVF